MVLCLALFCSQFQFYSYLKAHWDNVYSHDYRYCVNICNKAFDKYVDPEEVGDHLSTTTRNYVNCILSYVRLKSFNA